MSRPAEEACELLASSGLQHDRAQLAIAAALTGSEPEPTAARLDDAARGLFGAGASPVRDQARLLADLLTDGLSLQALGGEHRALLIDEALARREAHPLLIAVIGHELARRAGLRSFVGAIGARHWTVLQHDAESALVGCELLETPPSPVTVRPRCAHEVAGVVLKELLVLGPPGWRPCVDELRRALPLRGVCRDDEGRE
ncbi:MAG: hypothetical protein QM729_11720 [Solirubrobacterales bacterium]